MKGILKKAVPVLLSGLIACFSIMSGYVQVQAAAVTTWGLMEVIEALFASFGVSYMTYDMFDHFTDGNNALQPDWQNIYDSMEDSYEKQWTVINGGGGTDPTPSPTPELETPPHFAEIVKTAMVSGVLELGKESYGMIKTWMDANMPASYEIGQLLCDKTMPEGMNIDPAYITGGDVVGLFHFKRRSGQVYDLNDLNKRNPISASFTDAVVHASKPACIYDIANGTVRNVYSAGTNGRIDLFNSGSYVGSLHYSTTGSYLVFSDFTINYVGTGYSNMISVPVFTAQTDAINYVQGISENEEKKVKAPIWVSPEIQDTYENAGKLEFPENAPQSINVPNIDQLAQLAQQLQNATSLDSDTQVDAATSAMQKYLASLQTSSNPDPGTDPAPTTAPDPEPQPTATPEPDNPGTEDPDKESFTADLKELFPFCIPFDLIHALDVLSTPGQAPVFKLPFKIDYGSVHIDESWEIDFSDYESVVEIFRVIETLGFIVGLILITRNIIKG